MRCRMAVLAAGSTASRCRQACAVASSLSRPICGGARRDLDGRGPCTEADYRREIWAAGVFGPIDVVDTVVDRPVDGGR